MSYHDTRKFGRMYLYPKKEDIHAYPCFKNVGYDYMDERVNGMYFYTCVHSLKRNLKSCLLDQSIMAGVGNSYADEICFASGLDPISRASKLSKKATTMLQLSAPPMLPIRKSFRNWLR